MKKTTSKFLSLTIGAAMLLAVQPTRANASDSLGKNISVSLPFTIACAVVLSKQDLGLSMTWRLAKISACATFLIIGANMTHASPGIDTKGESDLKNTQTYKDLVAQLGKEKADDLIHDVTSGAKIEDIAKNYFDSEGPRSEFIAAISSARGAVKQPSQEQAVPVKIDPEKSVPGG